MSSPDPNSTVPGDCDVLEDAIRSVKDGDSAAFRIIVERMLPVLRSFVVARSLPGIDVDEIVQRTFVEAYKSIGQYQADSNFKAWLLTIARYQTMMESTRIRRQADYHSRYLPVALADQMEKQLKEPGSEDERLAALRDCLAALKSKSRQLIRRRYAEDLSMDDIAAAVNRSSGAVRKELCLLRKQLHQCIGRKLKLNNDATQGA